jgi:hypothetical protein
MSCSAGFEAAFGKTIPEVEYHWRLETLGINPTALVFRNLLPYILLFLILFGAAITATLMAVRKHRTVSAG